MIVSAADYTDVAFRNRLHTTPLAESGLGPSVAPQRFPPLIQPPAVGLPWLNGLLIWSPPTLIPGYDFSLLLLSHTTCAMLHMAIQ